MNLEDQVCSLELAKRLHELGVKQESLFFWWEWQEHTILRYSAYAPEISGEMPYSAFTVAELGDMLPSIVLSETKHGSDKHQLEFNHRAGYWQSIYYASIQISDKNESNSRAKILIHLIENKLMEVPR